MTEEDQESNFDEAHEVEPIKVSVKFKPQERVAESEVKFLDNKDTFQDVNRNESSSENQFKEVTCDNSDSRHVCFPIDTSATSIPLAVAAARKAQNDVCNLEVTRIPLFFFKIFCFVCVDKFQGDLHMKNSQIYLLADCKLCRFGAQT